MHVLTQKLSLEHFRRTGLMTCKATHAPRALIALTQSADRSGTNNRGHTENCDLLRLGRVGAEKAAVRARGHIHME